jgi:hypothetical protein
MSTDRDTTRIVRSWLEEGVTTLPDRVLDAVLDQVPATSQRRSQWPARRLLNMNSYTRLGLGAAAAVAVVLAGIALIGKPSGVGPATSPTPSSASFVSPSPGTTSNPLVGTWLAPEVTCTQQVATIEAAGYTAEQIIQAGADLVAQGYAAEGYWDPTCADGGADQYSLVFDGLPAAATILSARVLDHGSIAGPQDYRIADDSTLEFGAYDRSAWEYCLTLRYAIDGDRLTLDRTAPTCPGTAEAPLLDQIALTTMLEGGSFTRQP